MEPGSQSAGAPGEPRPTDSRVALGAGAEADFATWVGLGSEGPQVWSAAPPLTRVLLLVLTSSGVTRSGWSPAPPVPHPSAYFRVPQSTPDSVD